MWDLARSLNAGLITEVDILNKRLEVGGSEKSLKN